MRSIVCFLLACMLYGCTSSVQPLFRIISQDKIGYIDSSGKEIIAPRFIAAGDFSEGLAEARTAGTYGYINSSGEFVIKEQFDFATPFSEGLAVVYKDGIPFYINKKGERMFGGEYEELSPFSRGRAQVVTSTGRTGFINNKGELVIDTAFHIIRSFIGGYAVAIKTFEEPYTDEKGKIAYRLYHKFGIIDSIGHFLVPLGKYSNINSQSEGYYRVEKPADTIGYETRSCYLNHKGEEVLMPDSLRFRDFDGDVRNGLIKAYLKNDSTHEHGVFIDISGKIIFQNAFSATAEFFSNNRSFAVKNGMSVLIDVTGRQVTDQEFVDEWRNGFEQGGAIVKFKGSNGLIDTNGHFLIPPKYDELLAGGDGLYFFKMVPHAEYGIVNRRGQVIVAPRIDDYYGKFNRGLLLCMVNHLLTYINHTGKIIWQEKKAEKQLLSDVDIDYRLPGYFKAFSVEDLFYKKKSLGGYAKSDNYPGPLSAMNNFPKDSFGIRVAAAGKDTFEARFKGRRVEVFNTTADTLEFDAQDSRLYVKTQAMTRDGQWRDIEYLPSSWCGNSYHVLSLPGGQYWSFIAPVYTGDIPVKMRIELTRKTDDQSTVIYSPVFDGKVNPAQFWRKPDFHATNIMDPTIY